MLAVTVLVVSSAWWDELGFLLAGPTIAVTFGLVYVANRLHWAGH